ncbi:hypothetical protein COCMIDRAFT_23466 [Bipolaris oryzae ATCC 44560]|uniref:Uncharacterized protein n=1 Tax=Bipolaris oryzae ATCC 44560 TaxID=930090 RepID=W6ZN31_COCMI|nr:uncharacterized protein COCMIDRAFT_23466 [Bipolaris oryzae ATCC 44560]EUC48904.1 hypothetical protein COCMIDRAFT_23466 [Bipolaris oryzae ATCC 44560]
MTQRLQTLPHCPSSPVNVPETTTRHGLPTTTASKIKQKRSAESGWVDSESHDTGHGRARGAAPPGCRRGKKVQVQARRGGGVGCASQARRWLAWRSLQGLVGKMSNIRYEDIDKVEKTPNWDIGRSGKKRGIVTNVMTGITLSS